MRSSDLIWLIALSVALHMAAGAALYFFSLETPERVPERAYVVRIAPPEPPQPAPPEEIVTAAKPAPPMRRAHPPPAYKPPVSRAPELARPLPGAGEIPAEAPPITGETEAPGAVSPAEKGEGGGLPEGAAPGGARLFDPEVMAGVIEKGRKPKPPESGVTFNTAEVKYWGYMRKLKAKIEDVWEYPSEAAAKGIYGDLVIRFVIKKDGSLGAVELVRTSGWRVLDKAAIAALKDAAPYWPLPEDWGAESFTVTGHFIYTHRGYYLR